MKISDRIRAMVWLFPRGDSRKNDVRAIADEVAALEESADGLLADLTSAVNLIDPRQRPPRFDHLMRKGRP